MNKRGLLKEKEGHTLTLSEEIITNTIEQYPTLFTDCFWLPLQNMFHNPASHPRSWPVWATTLNSLHSASKMDLVLRKPLKKQTNKKPWRDNKKPGYLCIYFPGPPCGVASGNIFSGKATVSFRSSLNASDLSFQDPEPPSSFIPQSLWSQRWLHFLVVVSFCLTHIFMNSFFIDFSLNYVLLIWV